MRILLKPNDTLTAVLGGSAATTNPSVLVDYTNAARHSPPNTDLTALNGATSVTLLAPTQEPYLVEGLHCNNVDTAAVTLTIKRTTGGTTYTLFSTTLQVGDTFLMDAVGVRVMDNLGNLRQQAANSGTTFGASTFTGALARSYASGITAGTTRNQGGATALTKDINRVDTSTAPSAGTTLGDGVALPASAVGDVIRVVNNTANNIQVYGVNGGSDSINGIAGSTGVALPPGDVAEFTCAIAGDWRFDAGVGASGQYDLVLACDSFAALGSSQGTAANLTAVFNRVTTATGGTAFGVRLPTSAAGFDVVIENHSGVALQVYGASTDKIDDVTSATGVVQMDSSVVIYTCYAPGNWYTNGLATGYAKNPTTGTVLETMQSADNLTAVAGGIGSALQLTAGLNTIGTCPTSGGAILPVSAAGLQVTVINNGANPLLVFGDTTNTPTINGASNTTGVVIFPGTTATFNCTNSNAWSVQAATTQQAAYNTVGSATTLTLTAAQVTGGAASVDLSITGSTAITTFNTPAASAIVAALHSPVVGTTYRLRIINTSGSATSALAAGSGVTLANFSSGVHTIANNTWREYVVKVTAIGTPAVTMTSVATGTWS